MVKTNTDFMLQAIALGHRGLGRTASNPAVGCVIVDADARVIATGWTQEGGRPHAETHALSQAQASTQGAHAYVTLEPCAHHGETGPCAQALIDAGIAKVSIAHQDPDHRVAGKGIAMLRAAGIVVETDHCAEEAARLHQGFFARLQLQRPMVTLKLATSANGFMRTPEGCSPWITGQLARQYGHLLRAQHDAIMTGAGTLHSDNPSLDCRLPALQAASPLPVIMSHQVALPEACKLAARADAQDILFYTDAQAARLDEMDLICLDELTPKKVLHDLAGRGINRVLLECGPGLAKSFLAADMVDALAYFKAPHEVALDEKSDISILGLDAAALEARFTCQHRLHLGDDIYEGWQRRDEGGSR